MDSVQTAIELIESFKASFVVINQGKIVHQDLGIGVSCILSLMNQQSTVMKEATVVDKVIGKAAAMLMIKGNVHYAYGLLMSEAAMEVLEAHHVQFGYKVKVESIMNRQNNDLCPLEKAVLEIDDVDEALSALRTTIQILMKNK